MRSANHRSDAYEAEPTRSRHRWRQPPEQRARLRKALITACVEQRSFYQLNPEVQFMPNWHIEVIASELEACLRGETRRLIITVPPRSLKSHCASVAFPAWLLGHNPSAQIICASYGQDLANKLALDCPSPDECRLVPESIFHSTLKPAAG